MSECVRFPVHQVAVKETLLPPKSSADLQNALSKLGVPQAFSPPSQDLPVVEFFDNPNLFATAVYHAFFDHYPLKLNPNVVWLTILQGFSSYVSGNAEELRDKFVTHKGKEVIKIVRDDFAYQNPNNDWVSVFPQYADELKKRTNDDIKELLECNFSNTNTVDSACSHITLMSICRHYFDYRLRGGCGIPWIALLGEAADWRLLKQKAEGLRRFQIDGTNNQALNHFQRWLNVLLPLLDHFVSAAEGRPDAAFWGSACNIMGGSGGVGAPITGWIASFFPYIMDEWSPGANKKPWICDWSRTYDQARWFGVEAAKKRAVQAPENGTRVPYELVQGVSLRAIPTGMASAPVIVEWPDVGKMQDLKFYAGIFAIHQHPDGALEPRTGWAVVET
jgi:hypothetical protein